MFDVILDTEKILVGSYELNFFTKTLHKSFTFNKIFCIFFILFHDTTIDIRFDLDIL